MAKKPRISKVPSEFDDYMIRTDDYQSEIITLPSTKRCTIWNWTGQESNDWTAFRVKSNLLYEIFSDPDRTGPAARKKMRDHIAFVRAYDNNKITGHHLLDKIATSGNIDDCKKFNIKRSTALESNKTRKRRDVTLKPPVITLKKFGLGYHILSISFPDNPDSKAIPKGVRAAKVRRYIGTQEPENLKIFESIGNVVRGRIVSKFSDFKSTEGEEVKIYAWYYVCYENSKGEFLEPGPVLRVDVALVTTGN
jgi:hypothetical protein